jgi:hypothetical protein
LTPHDRDAAEAPADPGLDALALLARRSLPGDATRRDAASFAKIREKMAARRRERRVQRGAVVAALSLSAAAAFFVTRTRALTYRVVNGAVVEGAHIVGGAGTEVRFSDGSELTLTPGSDTRIASLDARGGHVNLDDGTAQVKIAKLPGAAWTLGAGPYSVRVTGTAFKLHWSRRDQAFEIAMASGSVVVTGPLIGSGMALHAGQRLRSSVDSGRLVVEEANAPVTDETAAAPNATPSAALPAPPPAPTAAATPGASPPPDASAVAAVVPSARPAGMDWRKKAARGEFSEVLDAAERRGLDATLAAASLGDLGALADSARYARRPSLAKRVLLAERSRFPGSGPARDAAFFLGRIAEDEGTGAIEWYDRYLSESPGDTYASQALGRKMMIVYQRRGATAAGVTAREYLERFPSGSYAGSAQKIAAELGSPER